MLYLALWMGTYFREGTCKNKGIYLRKMPFSILEKKANQIRRADLIRTKW